MSGVRASILVQLVERSTGDEYDCEITFESEYSPRDPDFEGTVGEIAYGDVEVDGATISYSAACDRFVIDEDELDEAACDVIAADEYDHDDCDDDDDRPNRVFGVRYGQ